MIKPLWTYDIQLWGAAGNSNIELLQRFQSRTLQTMVDVPSQLFVCKSIRQQPRIVQIEKT